MGGAFAAVGEPPIGLPGARHRNPDYPYIDPDDLLFAVAGLILGDPKIAQEIVDLRACESACGERLSVFDYLFVEASAPALGTKYGVCGYRGSTPEEREAARRAFFGNEVLKGRHGGLGLGIVNPCAAANVDERVFVPAWHRDLVEHGFSRLARSAEEREQSAGFVAARQKIQKMSATRFRLLMWLLHLREVLTRLIWWVEKRPYPDLSRVVPLVPNPRNGDGYSTSVNTGDRLVRDIGADDDKTTR